MARGRQLYPFKPGDVVGGFKILHVGADRSSKKAQTYLVERTCECREHLQVTHEHAIRRRTAGIVCCRECAAARLSFQQALVPPRRLWTEDMDTLLQAWAGRFPAHVIAAKLGLKDAASVYRRAHLIGLKLRRTAREVENRRNTTRPERAAAGADPR